MVSILLSVINNLFCVQWLYNSSTTTAGSKITITFPIKFTTTNYVLCYNPLHNGQYNGCYGQVSDKTITKCGLIRAHEPFHVVIIGY